MRFELRFYPAYWQTALVGINGERHIHHLWMDGKPNNPQTMKRAARYIESWYPGEFDTDSWASSSD